MKAIVVYESHWGNTAAIARAIAEGIGSDARAMSTGEAANEAVKGVELIVAGAPLLGFTLPSEKTLDSMRSNPGNPPKTPDLTHPSMRTWLASLPKGHGVSAAFETRIWWSPGGATQPILHGLESIGYKPVDKGQRFIVTGKYGPLREGELARAKAWGAELAKAYLATYQAAR